MTNEDLVCLIQKGIDVEENLNKLYETNKGFIYNYVKRYSGGTDKEDLMQEAFLGLKKAVDLYDINRGVKFLTYAGNWIKKYVKTYSEKMRNIVYLPITTRRKLNKYLKDTYYDGSSNTTDFVSQNMLKIIHDTNDYYNLEEISELYGIMCEKLDVVEFDSLNDKLWSILKNILNDVSYDLLVRKYKHGITVKQIAESDKVSSQRIYRRHKAVLNELAHNSAIKEIAQDYGII